MSHYKIIELSPNPIKKSNFDILDIEDDPLFLERSDYGGEKWDYKEVIDQIAKDLRPVAFVNKRRRTITFKSKKSVTKTYLKNISYTVREFRKHLMTGSGEIRDDYALHSNIDDVCGCIDLFYVHYCQTLSGVISDYLNGCLPRKLHIGRILSGHF